MKYRIFALMSLLAMGAGSLALAQDYDDIYYDAKKSSAEAKTKVVNSAKTVAVYGEVPEKYKEAVQVNYSTDRDVDEYNRRGAYDPSNGPTYEVDINGDTIYFYGDSIYDESFANTRRIERFYNPDIVILSDDEDLVELYYDESPTINLIIGSDWGYGSYYDWGFSSYYPWYTGWYHPWYTGWYRPWYYGYGYWHRPWYDSWYWGYTPWYYSSWGWGHNYWSWGHRPYWGWDNWSYTPNHNRPHRYVDTSARPGSGRRTGLATNRNTHGRMDARGNNRNGISARGADGSRSSGVGATTSRNRTGYATNRSGGNMGSRNSSGVTTRNSGSVSRSSSGTRSYSGSSPSRSYSGGSSSRSSGSYSGGSRSSGSSHSSGSYSGGSSHSSGGGGGHSGSSGSSSRRH